MAGAQPRRTGHRHRRFQRLHAGRRPRPRPSSSTAHIPGARFLDISRVADRSNPAPHMLPSAAEFGASDDRAGVGRDDRIIVYDNSARYAPPRAAGSCSAISARSESRSSMAASRNGAPKTGRSKAAKPAARGPVRRPHPEGEVVTKEQHACRHRHADPRRARESPVRGQRARSRPNVGAGHIPGSRTCPSPRSTAKTGR